MGASLAQRGESLRAWFRARAALRDGDRVCVSRCGGGRATFALSGWEGYWMCGKGGGSDYAPASIVSVGGKAVSFLDPPWEHYDPATGLPYGEHGKSVEALEWALDVGDRVRELDDAKLFMRAWRDGSAWEEWPEYYHWLISGPPLLAPYPRRERIAELIFDRNLVPPF